MASFLLPLCILMILRTSDGRHHTTIPPSSPSSPHCSFISQRPGRTVPYNTACPLAFVDGRQTTSSSPFSANERDAVVVPSKTTGIAIELPNFEDLFGQIQMVSPLANQVIKGEAGGFSSTNAIDKEHTNTLPWKSVESDHKKIVHEISKIDHFQNHPPPLIRFRSTLTGPCVGNRFAHFIMDLDERKKWDPTIDDVYQIHTVKNLDDVNRLLPKDGHYGSCTLCGVGYTKTKPTFAIDAREQLTLCGIQEFDDDRSNATIIWGVEMDYPRHDSLFPEREKQMTRAKSHLFATTIVPREDDNKRFDVEYVLQLDFGGMLPQWLTSPILIQNVKNMFEHAKEYYGGGEGGDLDVYLKSLERKYSGVVMDA